MTPQPEDPYGIAKYAVELDLAAAHEMFGLDYTIFRPHNVYGERQNIADRYRNVIGIFMNAVLQDEPMTVFGDGLPDARVLAHRRRRADHRARAAGRGAPRNEMFNIGADQPYTILELAEEIGRGVRRRARSSSTCRPATRSCTPSPTTRRSARSSARRAASTCAPGIERMAAWVREHGARDPIDFVGEIEIERNLPPSWRQRVR